MMPPTGMPRPDPTTREALITWMEGQLDSHSATNLMPPGIHRLNRVEYNNVIRDLLALEVDASKFLPSDDSTHGFDNIAGALTMSPALTEAYSSAAGKISRHTVGITFIAPNYAPGNDLNNAFLRSTILSSPIPGFTRYPHVGQVRIDGPFDAKGAADTPSRRKIFVCRPTGAKDEETCARQIV